MKSYQLRLYFTLLTCSGCLASSFGSLAQTSPGGVGNSNLTAWFRADDLPVGNVTSWTTTFPSGASAVTVTDPSSPYAQLETTPTGAVSNYNRTLHFSGNSFAGLNTSTLQGLSLVPAPDLLDNAYSGNQGSFFTAYYLPPPSANNGHLLIYNEGSDAIQCRNLNNTGRIALGLLPSNSTSASRDWVENFRPNVTSYKGNRSNSTSMKGYNKGALLPTPATASQSSGSQGLYIGYGPSMGTSAYNGYMHEFIFFDRDLTDSEMAQVHTYLAIKYGITLSNNGGGTYGDYVATNGSLIWDASNQPLYHNDVIGIGRDDSEGLYQRQSHAFDDSTRIYIDNLASYNELNSGTITNNTSYVLMGHNADRLCGTIASAAEVPIGVSTRLEREFKCTKSNFPQEFNWDLKIDTCTFLDGLVDPTNIRLLVDADGDFSDAMIFDSNDGLAFSFINGTVSVQGISGVHIPNNSTRFITLAYMEVSVSASGSGPVCEGETGWILFNIQNAGGPINIPYTDGINNLILNGVENGDTLYINPTTTTTYTFEQPIALFNCCGAGNFSTYTQVINPLPQVNITTSSSALCAGGSVTLTASGASTYQWSGGIQNGVSFTPSASQTYTVIGATTAGCTDTVSTSVTVFPLPDVVLDNPDTIACAGDFITYTATGAVNYGWTGGITNGVPFAATTGTWNYTVTGIDANGCSSSTQVTLVVYDLPDALASADVLSGTAPLEVHFENWSTNATSFWWDFANGATSNSSGPVSVTYSNGGSYTVVLTATNGPCTDEWTEILEVFSATPVIVLPNVFTPNNDGINDSYAVQTENVTSLHGYILNRWGNTVHTFDQVDFKWFGTDEPDGVYTILYEAVGANGTVLSGHGFIHLER